MHTCTCNDFNHGKQKQQHIFMIITSICDWLLLNELFDVTSENTG